VCVNYTHIPGPIMMMPTNMMGFTCHLRECRLIRVSISGLPYYCTPLVCVPAVIGALPVWWQNTFVTYKLMMMVSTQKVCTPPRYATILVFFYLSTVPVFLKIWRWRVSTSLKSGTVDIPIECWCPGVFPEFTILRWCIKLDGSPRGGVPTHLLPMLCIV